MKTNIMEYLDYSAVKYKDKVAFDDLSKNITFGNLEKETKKIASGLLNYQNKPIAIFMDKSVECITTMFGVIQSGNFYTIIDTNMPVDRINKIFDTLKPVAVITLEKLKKKTTEFKNVLFYEDLSKNRINQKALDKIRELSVDTDPVYTLFTSGSTGIPKGYVINHKGVIDFIEAMTYTFDLKSKDVFANQSPLYFDLSINDVFGTLKNGCLKRVLFCGEVMPNKQLNMWRKALPKVLYANLYGPAETVDASTYYIVNRRFKDDDMLPIGKPFKNTKVLVISEDNKLVTEPEVIGELCIAGSSLSMGYYNNKEKTDAAYVQNPVNDSYIEMIYKTGDLVKYNKYNELVFVSRKDYQIKHMGYRIELGEIETAISKISSIETNACIYDDNKKQIVMFYTGKEMSTDEIIQKLKDKLPKYMLPNIAIYLKELPHNMNGKVDRKDLKTKYMEGRLL